jgi:serine/threonine-protein kinase RsbW
VRVLGKRVKSVPDVRFCLVFRREAVSVPVMRRVLGDTLRGLGVDEESVNDILLAATEACTNVLVHAGRQARGYTVMTSVGAVRCEVEVAGEGAGAAQGLVETGRLETGHLETGHLQRGHLETGHLETGHLETGLLQRGLKAAGVRGGDGAVRETAIAQLAESGRGLAVMRACVDTVTLDSSPERGTVVTMSKHIRWSRDAPLRQFSAAS